MLLLSYPAKLGSSVTNLHSQRRISAAELGKFEYVSKAGL